MHKICNIGINANFVFPLRESILLHLHQMMFINIKLDPSGYKKITFQGCTLHCFCSFLLAQLKLVILAF